MPMQFKKVSDVGTENPIVARLSLQWSELAPLYGLSRIANAAVFGILFEKVQPRLIECERIALSLKVEVGQIQDTVDRLGLSIQAGGRAVECPSVMRLKERAEDYLYEAKLALRDYSLIFPKLFGKDTPKGNFAKIAEWAERKFGKADELSRLLREDHDLWIKRLCAMRDAVEHPDGPIGPLDINDFRLDFSQPRKILVIEPTWNLRGEVSSSIVGEMLTFNNNLLTFCEELALLCLSRTNPNAPIALAQIPENDRDPAKPMRFRAHIDRSKLKSSKIP